MSQSREPAPKVTGPFAGSRGGWPRTLVRLRALKRRAERSWLSVRFEYKLIGAVLAMLAFGLLMAIFASWTARNSQELFERSRLAHAVLDGLRRLETQEYELLTALSTSLHTDIDVAALGALKAGEEARIKTIVATVDDIRQLIRTEITLVGDREDENELDELERLATIDQSLSRLRREYRQFASVRDRGSLPEARAQLKSLFESSDLVLVRDLIKAGIKDEIDETEESNARARDVLNRSERLAILVLVLASIFGATAIATLIKSLRRPFEDLRSGIIAFGNDNLQHRIPVRGRDEFGDLAMSFNQLASELEARRAAMVAAKRALETAVSDRTRELLDANVQLEAADSQRRRFLADISHELRTPLTIIRGESDVALRGTDKSTDDYKNALQRIQEQASHTSSLVDDLLFLARRNSFELQLKLKPVALGEFIEQTTREFEALARQKRIRINVRNDVKDAMLMADRSRLRQLVNICLDNAVRYSQADGEIDVILEQRQDGVGIIIQDHGIGIDPDELPNIFIRFYRGAQAQQFHAGGSGLGLPMAKSLAEAHGGSINIESEVDRGSKVTVLLPATRRLRVSK